MPTANDGKGWDEFQSTLYQNHSIVNEFEMEPGVMMLPIAETPPTDETQLRDWSPVVVVRYCAPHRIRKTRYDVKKQNTPPVLPAPQDTGKFKVLSNTFTVTPTLNATLRNFDWTASMEVVSVEQCRSEYADGFVLGIQPWTLQTQLDNFDYQAPVPAFGAVAAGGVDALSGWGLGSVVNFNDPLYSYTCGSFFPGKFFNKDLLNDGPSSILSSSTGS